MEEGEDKGLGRRGFLKSISGIVAALGLAAGAKYGIDRIAEARWDPTRPENLNELLGSPELFPGWHSYFKGKIKLREGASIYKEPRVENPPQQGSVITVPTTGNTLLGSLKRGEEIVVENPFLFLKEADPSTDEASTINIVGPAESIKRADVSRSWVIFDIKGARLPESIKGDSFYSVGCARVVTGSMEFIPEGGEATFLLKPENVTFGQQISFGRVT